MLELLASYTVVNTAGGGAALTDLAQGVQAFYDDELGWCTASGVVGGFCIVQLDGATYYRATSYTHSFVVDLQRLGDYLVILGNFNDTLAIFNKLPFTVGDTVASGGTNFVGGIHARAVDRYLQFTSTAVQYKPLDLSGSWVTEATLTGMSGTFVSASRTRDPNVLAVAHANGTIVYYDVEAQAQTGGVSYVDPNGGAWYSPKHDIFVAYIYPSTIKTYANSVRPATLSNPVAITPVLRGKVSRVRVQLQGSNSDACEGELVNWAVTAGLGELAQAQSETDADGYAFNDYIAPADMTGSVTVQAEVAF